MPEKQYEEWQNPSLLKAIDAIVAERAAPLVEALEAIATTAEANARDLEGRVITHDLTYSDVSDWEIAAQEARDALARWRGDDG